MWVRLGKKKGKNKFYLSLVEQGDLLLDDTCGL